MPCTGFSLMNAPDSLRQRDLNATFDGWTEDQMRERADELHGSESTVHIDWEQPIVRVADCVVRVPAWIELCPWD